MSRDAQNQAKKTFKESQGVFGDSQGNAKDLYSKILPVYEGEATNPQGFAKEDLAAMNTASGQSVGGATAGAVGEGNLEAARTRNAGGFAPALDEAVRSGERTLSTNALDVQGKNAALREMNRQAGISGLSSLYSGKMGAMLSALGLGNQSTNALTDAGKSGWFQNMTSLISSLKPGGSMGGGQSPSFSFGGG